MTDTPPGLVLAAELMVQLQALAAPIFARYGVDWSDVRRGGGWTNIVWLAPHLVLRMAATPERDSLLREAAVTALLPAAVGYPRIVEVGRAEGHAWCLAERLPGFSLGSAWERLTESAKVTALQGMWNRAQAVHTVSAAKAQHIVAHRAWFNNTDPAEAAAGLARVTQAGILSAAEGKLLQADLDRFWSALPSAPPALAHGDLTLDNVLWDGRQTSALLDFEFALLAPVQLDLNHLIKCAYGPDPAAPALQQAVAALARPWLATSDDQALLRGYAILLELWLLELWLAHPDEEGPLAEWEPFLRLQSLADDRVRFDRNSRKRLALGQLLRRSVA